jgi:hypothetical protein
MKNNLKMKMIKLKKMSKLKTMAWIKGEMKMSKIRRMS